MFQGYFPYVNLFNGHHTSEKLLLTCLKVQLGLSAGRPPPDLCTWQVQGVTIAGSTQRQYP